MYTQLRMQTEMVPAPPPVYESYTAPTQSRVLGPIEMIPASGTEIFPAIPPLIEVLTALTRVTDAVSKKPKFSAQVRSLLTVTREEIDKVKSTLSDAAVGGGVIHIN